MKSRFLFFNGKSIKKLFLYIYYDLIEIKKQTIFILFIISLTIQVFILLYNKYDNYSKISKKIINSENYLNAITKRDKKITEEYNKIINKQKSLTKEFTKNFQKEKDKLETILKLITLKSNNLIKIKLINFTNDKYTYIAKIKYQFSLNELKILTLYILEKNGYFIQDFKDNELILRIPIKDKR